MKRKVPTMAIVTARQIVTIDRRNQRSQLTGVEVMTLLVATLIVSGCASGTCYRCYCGNSTSHSGLVIDESPTDLPLPTSVVTKPKLVVPPEVGDKLLDHGKDYEWLIGNLQRVHIPRDGWKIRYSRIDQIDKWGGSMVLAPDIRLEEFSDGDTVYIEGEVLNNRASLYLSGPLYRISKLEKYTNKAKHHVARVNR